MKKLLSFSMLGLAMTICAVAGAQNKPPASPPAKVSETINSGATITISYSQPSVKGRTIGKDLEPMKNTVWRMGANKATVFETDKDVTIEGKTLAAGKYSIWGVTEDNGFRIIFNSVWDTWGTRYADNREKDVMSVTVQPRTLETAQERLTYTIDKSGRVSLLWGNMAVDFNVK